MEPNCRKTGKCSLRVLIVKFQSKDTRRVKRIQRKIPDVAVGQGNLYSIDFLDGRVLYLVVVFCECVPTTTTAEIKKILSEGITVDPGTARDEAVSFAVHKFAEFIGYTIKYTDVTVH